MPHGYALTGHKNDICFLRVARGAGLDRDSVVQAEVIATFPKQAVSRLLGRLNPLAMRAVDSCIRISLGLS
jgi:mRNA-degrading endonuclease toxin of MazEF toxin-antitoxin module